MKALTVAAVGALGAGLVSASVAAIYEPLSPFIGRMSYPACLAMDWLDTRDFGLSRKTASKILENVEAHKNAVENREGSSQDFLRLQHRMNWNNRIVEDAIARCGSREFYPADIDRTIRTFTTDPPVADFPGSYSPSVAFEKNEPAERCIRDVDGLISQSALDDLQKSLFDADELLQRRSAVVKSAERAVWDLWDRPNVMSMENFKASARERLNMVEDLPEICLTFSSIDTRPK